MAGEGWAQGSCPGKVTGLIASKLAQNWGQGACPGWDDRSERLVDKAQLPGCHRFCGQLEGSYQPVTPHRYISKDWFKSFSVG